MKFSHDILSFIVYSLLYFSGGKTSFCEESCEEGRKVLTSFLFDDKKRMTKTGMKRPLQSKRLIKLS